MLKRRLLAATSVITALSAAVPQAMAQQQAQFALEEITVTARKREESLMEVPLSITAVTAENIESAGVKDIRDLAQYTPGLFVQYSISSQATARSLTFRGLSVSNGGQLFIDGAPYVGQANPDLGALERVEVLLGPQSAYFGRSTFTGALNYITKDPGNEFKGKITASYASYKENEQSISLEGPIVQDKLAVRVTARHYAVGGFWTNRSDPGSDVGAVSKNSVMAVATFTPNDRLKAKLLLNYSVDDDGLTPTVALSAFNYAGGPATQYQSRQLSCNVGGIGFGPYWCGALPDAKNLGPLNQAGTADIISWYATVNPTIYNILVNNALNLEPNLFDPHWMAHFGAKQLNEAAHAVVDYTTPGGWTINSTTAFHFTKYQALVQPNYRDGTGVPNTAPNRVFNWVSFYLLFQGKGWDGSQELRVTSPQDWKLRFTGGANYLNYISPGNDNYGIQPSGPGVSGTLTRTVNSTPAVFAGLYYDVIPDVTIGAEARYQWDKITAKAKFPVPATAAAREVLRNTYKSFSPRVTLDWKFQQGGVVYALWSRGYRPGGFNTQVVGQPASVLAQFGNLGVNLAYAQEQLDNFELGLKSTWLDGRIQTAVGGYFDKWKNGQVTNSISVQTPTNIQMVSVTQNVGAVDLSGIEATGAFAVTKDLLVTANANYVHSNIKAYIFTPNGTRINGTTNVNGHSFPNAPVGWTFTITPTYTAQLTADWEWFARADWKHRGRYYVDASNIAWIPARDIFDLHLGVKRDNLNIEAFALNLTDNTTFQNGEYGADATCCSLGAANINEIRLLLPARRQFGVKATYNF